MQSLLKYFIINLHQTQRERNITRVNGKLRAIIIDERTAQPEEISEDYFGKLIQVIEQWQPNDTGSFHLHALLEQ